MVYLNQTGQQVAFRLKLAYNPWVKLDRLRLLSIVRQNTNKAPSKSGGPTNGVVSDKFTPGIDTGSWKPIGPDRTSKPGNERPNTETQKVVSTPPASKPKETPPESPTLGELREKLFAVHATEFIPPGGEMKAGAVHLDPRKRSEEPASFRPTIHFALGEMVREHGHASWERKPYGIVLPLRDLEPQLANVSPHDSFVVGNFKLPPGAVFLAPEGAKVEGLPKYVQVKHYKGKLRDAVDKCIEDQGGWKVNMRGVSADDPAKIGDRDINTPDFFREMLKENPKLSFGSHIGSETGEAYRYGNIEQSLLQLDRGLSLSGLNLNNGEARLYTALIDHHLKRLQVVDHPSARKAVEAKKQHIAKYLALADRDLKFRKMGFSLAGATKSAQKLAGKLSFLGPIAPLLMGSVLGRAEEGKPSMGALTEALRSLPPKELAEFESKNPEVFKGVDMGAFRSRYAVARWMHQRKDEEGLEHIFLQNVQGAKEPLNLMQDLQEGLKEDSYRKEVALSIMRRPAVQMNLVAEEGMKLSLGSPRTLREAIKAHPVASRGLERWEPTAPPGYEASAELLKKVGGFLTISPPSKLSFSQCKRTGESQEWANERFHDSLKQMERPMNSVRNPDDIQPGEELSLLELVRRDGVKGVKIPPEAWQTSMPFKDYFSKLTSQSP